MKYFFVILAFLYFSFHCFVHIDFILSEAPPPFVELEYIFFYFFWPFWAHCYKSLTSIFAVDYTLFEFLFIHWNIIWSVRKRSQFVRKAFRKSSFFSKLQFSCKQFFFHPLFKCFFSFFLFFSVSSLLIEMTFLPSLDFL